jgi:hypothetical protein
MSYYLAGKYKEITELVHNYRFINRHQIQQALHHKGPRRINSWLKDLTEEGFLGRIYSAKLLENTKPAIYYLSNKGISVIKEKNKLAVTEVKKFYEDKKRSQVFIDHCIFVAQLLLGIKQYDTEFRTYKIFPKEMILKDHFLSELKPDGYIEVYKKKTKKSKEQTFYTSYILNVIDPGVPRYAINYRIKQYIESHDEGNWKESISEFPSVLFVLPNRPKQNQLKRFLQGELNETLFDVEGLSFLLTTYDKAKENGLIDGIWVKVKEEE